MLDLLYVWFHNLLYFHKCCSVWLWKSFKKYYWNQSKTIYLKSRKIETSNHNVGHLFRRYSGVSYEFPIPHLSAWPLFSFYLCLTLFQCTFPLPHENSVYSAYMPLIPVTQEPVKHCVNVCSCRSMHMHSFYVYVNRYMHIEIVRPGYGAGQWHHCTYHTE